MMQERKIEFSKGVKRASEIANASESLYDLRFRKLLNPDDWDSLPAAVQRRFSKRLSEGQIALYSGYIAEARFSKIGISFAQACRIIGAPLPLHRDIGASAAVSVAEDGASGGQHWTRIYHREKGFPQTINSVKGFKGSTGLQEYIGKGIGMALKVRVLQKGLSFVSDHYFIEIGNLHIRLPRWMMQLRTEVQHIDQGDGWFDFSLSVSHKWLGELIYQRVRFQDR